MKVLFVVDFLYFTDGGAHVSACAHKNTLIKMYGKDNVDIISLTGPNDIEPKYNEIATIRSERNKVKLWFNCLNKYSTYLDKKGENTIINIISKSDYELIFIDNSIYGKLVKSIKQKFPFLPVVTYYHDVKANLAKKWREKASFLKKIVYQAMIESERINQQYSDVNLTLNPRESDLFLKYYKKLPDLQLGVYMDIKLKESYCKSNNKLDDKLKICFIGSSYKPNVDGVLWFLNSVMPLLDENVQLTIAGSNMDSIKFFLNVIPDNVFIFGHIDDLSELYEQSDVIISPIFDGGGMKVKMAHAMGFGKIIMGTDESYHGYQENIPNALWRKYFFRCNEAQDFINAIKKVKYDSTLRKFNTEVRTIFDEFYSQSYAIKVISLAEKMAKQKCNK